MELSSYALLQVLGMVNSPAGTGTILDILNSRVEGKIYTDTALRVSPDHGVAQYRKLKADLAELCAGATDNEAVMRYIAARDKRVGCRRHLMYNPNLPADVVDALMRDTQGVETLHMRSIHRPLDALLYEGHESAPGMTASRILAEATDSELCNSWLAKQCQGSNVLGVIHLTSECTWRQRVRLMPLIPPGESRNSFLLRISTDVNSPVTDWSLALWDDILEALPQDSTPNQTQYAHERIPSGLAVTAPVSWLLHILRNTGQLRVRRLAVHMTEVSALYNEEVRALLSTDEYIWMHATHPSKDGDRVPVEDALWIARQAVEQQSRDSAASILPLISGSQSARRFFPQDLQEELALLALESSWALEYNRVEDSSPLGTAINIATGAFGGTPSKEYQEMLGARLQAFQAGVAAVLENQVVVGEWLGSTKQEQGLLNSEFRRLLVDALPGDLGGRLARQYVGMASAIREFEERLPDADRSTWDLFFSLWSEWDTGTIGELIDAVEAMS